MKRDLIMLFFVFLALSGFAQDKKTVRLKVEQPEKQLEIEANGYPEYEGDESKFTVSGGTPDYTFNWESEEVNGNDVAYKVTVTDSKKCTASTVVLPTSTPIKEIPAELRVYPNPVVDVLNIPLYTDKGEVTISLFSATGKLLQKRKITCGASVFELSMKSYPAGMYFVRIEAVKAKAITHSVIKK